MPDGFLIATATVLAAFVAWLTTKWSTRKGYQYERSKHVTKRRLDDEYEQIQNISKKLYQLIDISRSPSEDSLGISKEQCVSEIRALLAESALPLYYYDLEDKETYCGVHACKGGSRKNLHMRAVEIIELDANEIGTGNKSELIERYEYFLHCAQCRLRNIEMGRRDTRRSNFKKAAAKALCVERVAKRFDARCPYEEMKGKEHKDLSKRLFIGQLKEQGKE